MIQHLTVRVPWHDNGWKGCVCSDPSHNNSCLRLKNILENRNEDFEFKHNGECMSGKEESLCCIDEGGAFMSSKELVTTAIHPYKESNPATHGHFLETKIIFPPYSFSARPFNWLLNNHILDNSKHFGINYDDNKEPSLSFNTSWIQDADNHKAVFDYFYKNIEYGKSLCIAYAKQVPFIENPGRVIIGMGHILNVIPAVEHNHTNKNKLRSMTWETHICHSIREDFNDGFIIPYKEMMEYAESHPEFDMKEITVFAPEDAIEEFSYATEHVSYDSVIEVIQECIKSFEKISVYLNRDYSNVINWLKETLYEIWKQRGAFPGIGSMLCALGIDKGKLIESEIKDNYDKEDIWETLEKVFDNPRKMLSKELAKEIPTIYQISWKNLDNRKILFKLLSRFPLNINQAISIFNPEEREKYNLNFTDEEIIKNPYILYEKTRLKENTSNSELFISIKKVDRSLLTNEKVNNKYPVIGDSAIESPIDQRRVRAIAISVLEKEAKNGNTILPCLLLSKKIKETIIEPECIVTSDIFNGIQKFLNEEIIKREMKDGTDYYKLVRINKFDQLIENRIKKRLAAEKLQVNANWEEIVNSRFGKEKDKDEIKARKEKVAILKELAKSRISVLVGGAGTGKTTLLSILCKQKDINNGGILLLAPTGKATVRMKESFKDVGGNYVAQNVAQFLIKSKRFNYDEMRYDLSQEKCKDIPQTVIIDESSMLTEEMFGALLDAVATAKRIIFVGDPYQLPPIGAGRPFVDLVNLLKLNLKSQFPKVCDSYGELTINRRQTSDETRLDVELSKQFNNSEQYIDDDVIETILSKENKDISFIRWDTKEELEKILLEIQAKELKMKDIDDIHGFNLALGGIYNEEYCYFNVGSANKIENFQILAPTKQKPQGINNINRLVHRKYRDDFINYSKTKSAKIPLAFGPDGIVYGDKVINVENKSKKAFMGVGASNYVANGEVGIVCESFKEYKPKFTNVEFSSQPGIVYGYGKKDSGSDDNESALELAYALTIHKAQGSQFNTVLLVLGEPCGLMSRELIYTALTRQEKNIIILYNDDPRKLLRYTSDRYSDICKRYTDLFADVFIDKGINYKPNIVDVNGDFYEEKLIHRTINGELVRSKSEVIIANCLHAHNLEYEYEPELILEGKLKRPDFKVIDYDTGDEWYIEHCGMMSDSKYKKRWEEKKKFYAKNGIIEGKNLLVTYDGIDGSIDSKEIDDLISEYLI